jgi:hypothetical protein
VKRFKIFATLLEHFLLGRFLSLFALEVDRSVASDFLAVSESYDGIVYFPDDL